MARKRKMGGDHRSLTPEEVRWTCDPSQFEFETTESLEGPEPFLGQKRALRALQFGAEARNPGFNVFVVGMHGSGRTSMTRLYLGQLAATRPTPDDWCYVHNFDHDARPRAVSLPAGRGRQLRKQMDELVKDCQQALPKAFEEEDYERDRMALKMKIEQAQAEVFEGLREKAEEQGYAVARTQQGFAVAPTKDGKVMEPSQLAELTEEEQEQLKAGETVVRNLLRQTLRRFRDIEKEATKSLENLERDSAEAVVEHLMYDLYAAFRDLPEIKSYLDEVKADILENLDEFKQRDEPQEMPVLMPGNTDRAFPFTDRYKVNLLVDNGQRDGAPVVHEDYPTYRNLLGRIDHETTFGTLVSHFTRIQPGSVHEANGGYLMIDAEELLRSAGAWEGLKRALKARSLKLEDPFEQFKAQTVVGMRPDPIPLDIKLVMVGTPWIFHLLHTQDPDFAELFKVSAEFRRSMNRSERSIAAFAGFCGARCKELGLLPLARDAVARLCEHSVRSSGQQDRFDLRFRDLIDLIAEADFRARKQCSLDGEDLPCAIGADHVQAAIDAREDRGMHLQETVLRLIREGTIRIDIEEPRVGQINGLSVLQMGGRPFGSPSRLSARVTAGQGFVANVEREVQLSGPFHNKGVLILTGYLKGRYGVEHPLSINASIVFEQSYSPVDGDSATLAEICAILSAIGEFPLRQDIAVTGSVDQMGQVQAVGGLNEKIEGFWAACQELAPDREVGVILPASNVRHLMLRPDVVAAVAAGKLRIWPVERVDEAIEILSGLGAEQVDELVEQRLEALRENVRGATGGAGESMVLMAQQRDLPSGPPDPGPKR